MEQDKRIFEFQARLCQVLASPKRLEILYTLKETELTAGDLAKAVDVTMPNLSQHLSLMKQHGLVESRKEGLNMYYRLSSEHILAVCDAVRRVLAEQLARQSVLLDHVTSIDKR
ncbi:MAG TPA: metalloregulator ArsR/SmtB family transcription factor [Symbiobacteriaceae bacterium]|jgi:ArsR family transcriptional regulator, virulence genes transcriptional regulator|nr:metalloregulator ArsR/SmtB family transcription factor [Symbiobacteriaceae bacterium]